VFFASRGSPGYGVDHTRPDRKLAGRPMPYILHVRQVGGSTRSVAAGIAAVVHVASNAILRSDTRRSGYVKGTRAVRNKRTAIYYVGTSRKTLFLFFFLVNTNDSDDYSLRDVCDLCASTLISIFFFLWKKKGACTHA